MRLLMSTASTLWKNVKAKAKVKGRWHDNRHTLITDRAEGGAGDETIRDTAGHISKQVLKHYSHTGLLAQKCRRVYEFEIQWTYCRYPVQVNFLASDVLSIYGLAVL